jgi:hypothetical protein
VQVCLICQVASNPWKHLGGHSNTLCGQMTQCIFEELIVHIHLTCRILESTSRSRPFINQHHRPQILDSINGTATTIQSSNQYRTTATKFSSAVGKPKVGATGYSDKPTARDIVQEHIATSVKELSRPCTVMSIPPQNCQAQGV